MCGIAGYLDPERSHSADSISLGRRMCASLSHRGPNDTGVWTDDSKGVCLSHARLSIIDTSMAGHQPMASRCGRYTIVFNGEIYNHLELRKKLPGMIWQGHSDTETLLAAIASWGIETALESCVGMFAFAVWDGVENLLLLARDRMGEKPLYYGWQNDVFIFGSELKALILHPAFEKQIDPLSLKQFFRLGFVPAPRSIYRSIQKLMPGYWLSVNVESKTIKQTQYWSVVDTASVARNNIFTGTESEAIDELERLLFRSVSGQLIADVKLGAFLSGGVDSSLIVALAQRISHMPVNTYSIGFHDKGFNEAEHAKAVAKYLGTSHTELYVTSAELRDQIPYLSFVYDEPFADASQLPTMMLAKLTKAHVDVALSGDGGDELFGGYNRYLSGMDLFRFFGQFPWAARNLLSKVILKTPHFFWDGVGSLIGVAGFSEKICKIDVTIKARNIHDLYNGLTSHWLDPDKLVILKGNADDEIDSDLNLELGVGPEHQMMLIDTCRYLPDDIMVKVDRATMAYGLESRSPFLDHRILAFSWSLPLNAKIHDRQGKYLVRKLLDRYIPRELIERPKQGFSVPLDKWLRGPLRDWSEALLAEDRIVSDGVLNPVPIRKMWNEHVSGKRNWQQQLWNVLVFQDWFSSISTLTSDAD